jgi:hypothetical protein
LKNRITRRLRGILNAWHFQFDSTLVFTAQWFRLGGGVVHPLTRRYAAICDSFKIIDLLEET